MVKKAKLATIDLGGEKVEYRLVRSTTARKLKVRAGIDGIEVIQPVEKQSNDLEAFLKNNKKWITGQLRRLEYIRSVRKPPAIGRREILFLGTSMPVSLKEGTRGDGGNKVFFDNNAIEIVYSRRSRTSPAKSLENWLRKQARMKIEKQLRELIEKRSKYPNKVYVRGQKTKWGNCSPSNNLSFNWRLIMAPDFVFRYLIIHEFVHLEVLGHSKQFWLIVQSLCPEMSRSKQWLRTNGHILMMDLIQICET
jgi:predicted metal-dependent hydrolase